MKASKGCMMFLMSILLVCANVQASADSKVGEVVTDSVITAKIKALYIKEKVFGDKDLVITRVHIETKDGVVYLTGDVDSDQEKKNAEELAKTIKGVKRVESSILSLK